MFGKAAGRHPNANVGLSCYTAEGVWGKVWFWGCHFELHRCGSVVSSCYTWSYVWKIWYTCFEVMFGKFDVSICLCIYRYIRIIKLQNVFVPYWVSKTVKHLILNGLSCSLRSRAADKPNLIFHYVLNKGTWLNQNPLVHTFKKRIKKVFPRICTCLPPIIAEFLLTPLPNIWPL